ncbi:uncharacterized protein LOC134252232 isoform X1 [Saccostrea cucullata]|uniref:uncharacterized protein LOC134252232 isoform X1 n=1 Tax=Saccostrea cuccullata TaxID=36930 RepID=UPI002ED11508
MGNNTGMQLRRLTYVSGSCHKYSLAAVLLVVAGLLFFVPQYHWRLNVRSSPDSNAIPKSILYRKYLHSMNLPKSSDGIPYAEIEIIRRDCGQLCNTSRPGSPGPYFNHVTAPVNCEAIFKNTYIDKGHGLKEAPRYIPNKLLKDFTMNFQLPVSEWYFDMPYLNTKSKTPVWTKESVEHQISLAKKGILDGTYDSSETNALRDGLKHAPGVKDGRVLVIGSENPWVEACVLEAGAKEVVTLEYGEIRSLHPKIKTFIPQAFRMAYLNKTLGEFDAVVTFSSVEHSGLGRYGDGLNPWGDIIAIARAWCVTKKGGSLTIGVMFDNEKDYIQFNAARYYGKIRYPYLATNWKQHYRGHGSQKIHVFVKP